MPIDLSNKLEQQPLLEKEKETPLPWNKVIMIGVILFGNTFSLCLVFPFLPFMTHDFFPELHPREIGFKAGYLGSAFSLGSFCAAYVWGTLSDRFGRKPVLLAGLFGTFFSIISFGCSRSFYWALASRFLWGLLNGNIGVAKTYLAEVLDSSNQARGFAIIGVQGGIGRLFGPIIGGLLSKPAEKYPFLNISLFREFPYLLPCLIAAFTAGSGFLGTLFFLEETLDQNKDKKEEIEAYACESPTGSPIMLTPRSSMRKKKKTYLIKESSPNSTKDNTSLLTLLTTRKIITSALLYGLIAAVGIMTNEIIPLWLLNKPEDGGYNFETSEIGMVFMISAPFEILYQIFLYPKLIQKYQTLGVIRKALISFGITTFILPFTSSTALYGESNWVQWPILCLSFYFMVLSSLSSFTCVFVLVNNSSTRKFRGRVNGIGQTMAAAARIIFPSVSSILFAWSENNGMSFPFNFHFVFIMASCICCIAFGISLLLPDSINYNPDFE